MRAHIARRCEHAGGHLPLDGQTPRLLLCVRQIRLVRVEPLIWWKGRKRRALGVNIRERISAWNIRIRIAEIQRPIEAQAFDKRCNPRRILKRKSLQEALGVVVRVPTDLVKVSNCSGQKIGHRRSRSSGSYTQSPESKYTGNPRVAVLDLNQVH